MSSMTKGMSSRPLSVDSPAKLIETVESPRVIDSDNKPSGLNSEGIPGLESLIKDSKGFTKANQTVLMTQEELTKILEERMCQHP